MKAHYFLTNLMRKNNHQQYDVLDEGWEKQMFSADNDMTCSCNFWLSTLIKLYIAKEFKNPLR